MRLFLGRSIQSAWIVAAMLAIASSVKAASYVGQVLYPLTAPQPPATWGYFGVAPDQVVGDVSDSATANNFHAAIWLAGNSGALDINPPEFTVSHAVATDGSHQVGNGSGMATGGNEHALVWSGTSLSALNIHPTNLTGFTSSEALGVHGTEIVGDASDAGTNLPHALLWPGIAAIAVDLNPAGFVLSNAVYTNGATQVGNGVSASGGEAHALVWAGSAASAVDLNPSGIARSYALGTTDSQQVGFGYVTDEDSAHAFLWTGTAASAVDLNPSGFTESGAAFTNGLVQVGSGNTGGQQHAVAWSGTAASATDLQLLLPGGPEDFPPNNWLSSTANTIDAEGNIFGYANGAYNGVNGFFAVEWSLVPEPMSTSLLAAGLVGTLLRRRR